MLLRQLMFGQEVVELIHWQVNDVPDRDGQVEAGGPPLIAA